MAAPTQQVDHPHYGMPSPPPGWNASGSEEFANEDLPDLLDTLVFVPNPQGRSATFVPPDFNDVTFEDALKKFFAGGPWATASTNFTGEEETDYGHLFFRDTELSMILIDGTPYKAFVEELLYERYGRAIDLEEEFLIQAAAYQGTRNVPNPKVPWANDGEQEGRIPHEIWPTWKDSDNAQYLKRELGWSWPIYFGAVDTTPLFAMRVGVKAKQNPAFLLRTIPAVDEDGRIQENELTEKTMLEGWIASVRHLVEMSRVDQTTNPEGLLQTRAMSNLCWGDWDDSYPVIRDLAGKVAEGSVSHFQLQVWARSAMLGLVEMYDRLAATHESGQIDEQTFLTLERAFQDAGFSYRSGLYEETRATADRFEQNFDLFLVRDHPEFGDYYALGLDRNLETGELRQLDILSAKPAYATLAPREHVPLEVAETLIRQTIRPENGLIKRNGISNVSDRDPHFGFDTYHDLIWDKVTALISKGFEKYVPGVSAEFNERGWRNALDPFVRGFHEFVSAFKKGDPRDSGRPLPVQRSIITMVKNSNPVWKFEYIKRAMGGQLWTLLGRIHFFSRSSEMHAGKAPHRVDQMPADQQEPGMEELEAELLDNLRRHFEGELLTDPMRDFYAQDGPGQLKRAVEEAMNGHSTGRIAEVPIGLVSLEGQRMPGEAHQGRTPEVAERIVNPALAR